MNDPADVLDAAAEVIERDGWCQNDWNDRQGRVCLLGAIRKAVSGNSYSTMTDDQWQTYEPARDAVYRYLDEWPPQFNDAEGRTQFEVIDALRGAAKDLRNEAAAS